MIRAALASLICVLLASGAQAEKRVALVIGNSAYKHAPELANPRNDAEDFAAALRALGIEVIKGLDLDKPAMDREIRKFSTVLAAADVGIFFYAGHGLQVNGNNYLVPIDAELSTAAALEFEMVRLDLVQRIMEGEAKTNILFLDACRNNPLSRNLARAMGTRAASIGRGLAAAESGVGTLISFSTQPGNVALDGQGRNSPYAGPLVKKIATAGEDVLSVLTDVRNEVLAATGDRQVPWENHALRARFYFNPAAPPAPQPSEAERAWRWVKDSTSPSVLENFIKEFADTPFAAMARARLEEVVRRQQTVAANPRPAAPQAAAPAVVPPPPPPPPPANEAAKAWGLLKGTAGVSDLEAFIRRHPDSPEAGLARARIAELRRKELASAAPAANVPAPAPAEPARVPAAAAPLVEAVSAERAYQSLMANVLSKTTGTGSMFVVGRPNSYRQAPTPKALSVCIRWEKSTLEKWSYGTWWFVSENQSSGWKPQNEDEARKFANAECRKRAPGDCKCTVVDINDRNVLKLPPGWPGQRSAR